MMMLCMLMTSSRSTDASSVACTVRHGACYLSAMAGIGVTCLVVRIGGSVAHNNDCVACDCVGLWRI